jgi:hypothetical protein
MTKQREYSPSAQLLVEKDADGKSWLIGTDPVLQDTTVLFRWPNEPHGWERRTPHTDGTAGATAVAPPFGTHSCWPGSIPVVRAVGRPRKEVAQEDRPISVSTSMRRGELLEIMQRAAAEKLTVSEWVAVTIRSRLAAEPAAASSERTP